PVGIELSGLLGELLAAVVIVAPSPHVAFAVVISTIAFLAFVLDERGPVCGAVDHVLHCGPGHRLAEVILGFDGGGDGFALENPRLVRRDAHFILGLLVFLHLEAAAHSVGPDPFAGDRDRVVAERCVGGQREVSVHAAELRDRAAGLEDLFPGWILHRHLHRFTRRNTVFLPAARAQDGLEVHRMARTIYRT